MSHAMSASIVVAFTNSEAALAAEICKNRPSVSNRVGTLTIHFVPLPVFERSPNVLLSIEYHPLELLDPCDIKALFEPPLPPSMKENRKDLTRMPHQPNSGCFFFNCMNRGRWYTK